MIYRIDYTNALGHRARLYRKNRDQVRFTAYRLVYGMLEGEGLLDRPIARIRRNQVMTWQGECTDHGFGIHETEADAKKVTIAETAYASLSEARNSAPEFDLT